MTHHEITTIMSRYDAEHDVPGPDCHPQVSNTEYRLAMIVEDQQIAINDLLKQVDALNLAVDRIEATLDQ